MGIHIPAPGVDVGYFLSKLNQSASNSILAAMTTISSGVFGSFSLLSLGVMPYILASILTQMIGYIYQEEKGLKHQKDNDFFSNLLRVFTLVFSLVQSFVLFWSIKDKELFFYSSTTLWIVYALVFSSILAGSMVSMWIGEVISEYSIGSGISMIIFTNIGFEFISGIIRVVQDGEKYSSMKTSILLGVILLTICVIVLCEKSSRRLNVNYFVSNKFGDNKVTKSSFIPLKLNFSGVMPMIFTATIIGFSTSILNSFLGSRGGSLDEIILFILRSQSFHYILYFLLILGFSLIYNNVTFNVERVSDSLRKSSGVIPGIKPGIDTTRHMSHILSRLTFIGAVYLFIVSSVVDLLRVVLNVNNFVSGTSYLIVTVIALELMSKYQVELLRNKYVDYTMVG